MNLIFLGPPGAGKGTIAKRLLDRFSLLQISTGDLFRENIKGQTEVGMKAKGFMDRGELVPDGIVIEMLKGRIAQDDCKGGVILDGFPRTIPQAEALAADSSVTIDKVVNFVVPDDVVVSRLCGRRICPTCGRIYHTVNMPPKVEGVCDDDGVALIQRDDDQPDAIQHRLVVYRDQTEPLIAFYRSRGMLADIDGALPDVGAIVESAALILEQLQG
ncbi:MAG: adenylate kinase [Lentisphaerae bacterium]|jgi:adenylate kinase|nr:adenylate kinase [Lentisphaerota bacterium]MBT4819584.1 adenylate kinase [Lentisphaerota bacterium]MBT5610782.1 adenylate kinase [Lentisphaerota bacterium]MBT7053786.1 adenylate kinase [Lentisphaerota bacterium]MBT7841247.1 adenylate kinase [Lentisphaerota bacterium]